MDTLTLTGTAFALAMDAFAVAVAVSCSLPGLTWRHTFRLSWHFGLFQAVMTIIGWLMGAVLSSFISNIGNWIACGILCILGGRMIWQSFFHESAYKNYDPTRGLSLISLSFATSMDALAVGVSLAMLHVSILIPSAAIGLVALFCTSAGVGIGRYAGSFPVSWSERLGGLVLIAIALKILLR